MDLCLLVVQIWPLVRVSYPFLNPGMRRLVSRCAQRVEVLAAF